MKIDFVAVVSLILLAVLGTVLWQVSHPAPRKTCPAGFVLVVRDSVCVPGVVPK